MRTRESFIAAAQKARQTRIRKAGSQEAYVEEYRAMAIRGGKAKVSKGFAVNRANAAIAGRKGGSTSRRGRAVSRDEISKIIIDLESGVHKLEIAKRYGYSLSTVYNIAKEHNSNKLKYENTSKSN